MGAEESAAENHAVLLTRKAEAATQKDGKKTLRAEAEARDAVKRAADKQEDANKITREETKKIEKTDGAASAAVSEIMNSKTGLSQAKVAAKDAQAAATIAAKKAARSSLLR